MDTHSHQMLKRALLAVSPNLHHKKYALSGAIRFAIAPYLLIKNQPEKITSMNIPIPELFANEDLNKHENRVNIALFSLMAIPKAKELLLNLVNLPIDSIIYPPRNVKGVRPDFVIVNNDEILGWVEVELGNENIKQLESYKNKLSGKIISIVGKRESKGDLSLEQFSDSLNEVHDWSVQEAIHVKLFSSLVNQLCHKNNTLTYQTPNETIQNCRLMALLSSNLEGHLIFGFPPFENGKIQITTTSQQGWTIKVMSKESTNNTFSLAWSKGDGRVRIPSKKKLDIYFPKHPELVANYVKFFLDIDLNITNLDERESLDINEEKIIQKISDYSKCLYDLATIYSRG